MKVKDAMSKVPFCCTATDSIQNVAELMRKHEVGAIPVVTNCNGRKLVGIVTDRDICVRAVAAGNCRALIGHVMTRDPVTCGPEEPLETCEVKMEEHQVRRVPVVDSQGSCIGIVAQADIVLHDSPNRSYHTVSAISQRPAPVQVAVR